MLRLCSVLVLSLLPSFGFADFSGVLRVTDADTVDVGDVRVRLHAIDAPEVDQTCETAAGQPFACGTWATVQVEARFGGQTARCETLDTDRYGRTVAKCRVDGADMGAEIVSAGWAFAYRRYGMDYDLDEKAAYVAGRGLHGYRVQSPAAFREARGQGRLPPDPACRIKGNISGSGQIFHVPGQEFYDRTGINEARGERWFCSEGEALRAGWRPARR
ncbi:thermonuclease family protein [Maritimibacter sp. DP1N21-5]|uniref:thermonuclease family protein n=1 Tax=Roseobacteraceae TaxID=2854170 RepID=UPI001C484B14|nr:thermonuclease family protein [Maritimibacter sp. DP1N21-5]MBV7408943.1 thermonuclease family protein [Maritimibacter sp. DP1N21-5]MBY5934370.1 thermonuclease family protein [Tateyamaria omphalii]